MGISVQTSRQGIGENEFKLVRTNNSKTVKNFQKTKLSNTPATQSKLMFQVTSGRGIAGWTLKNLFGRRLNADFPCSSPDINTRGCKQRSTEPELSGWETLLRSFLPYPDNLV